MDSRAIETADGSLHLVPPSTHQLRGIAHYWPMELFELPDAPGRFGLVFQHGEREVHGVKLQPVDLPEGEAMKVHHVNRCLIAAALPHYLQQGHRGVMVPCAYFKQKGSGMAESGVVFFVGPDPASARPSEDPADGMYDEHLGAGATAMIFDMARALRHGSDASRLPLMTILGIDLRPRLAVGSLAMYVVLQGSEVFVVKDALDEAEPFWRYLLRAGFSTLPYAPMVQAGFPT